MRHYPNLYMLAIALAATASVVACSGKSNAQSSSIKFVDANWLKAHPDILKKTLTECNTHPVFKTNNMCNADGISNRIEGNFYNIQWWHSQPEILKAEVAACTAHRPMSLLRAKDVRKAGTRDCVTVARASNDPVLVKVYAPDIKDEIRAEKDLNAPNPYAPKKNN